MIILKRTTECDHAVFSCHESADEFSDAMRDSQHYDVLNNKVFIWQDFGKYISEDFFINNDCHRDFVGLFGDQDMWPWQYRTERSESDRQGNFELMEVLASPQVNTIASLCIRNYDSTDQYRGSFGWLEDMDSHLNDKHTNSRIIIDHVMQSMKYASRVGVRLYLEKISLMINNNPDNPITLSPHLHRDGAYGHLESAVVSLYSTRNTPHASTIFFPDFDFDAASHLKPLTADKLRRQPTVFSGYSLDSGHLAVFSGKIGKDGSKSDSRGGLHISPEGFVPTRRIVLLFRSHIYRA